MAREILRLTSLQVTRASEPGTHHDGAGLHLQITEAKGGGVSKSWLFCYTSPVTGKERWAGLGTLADFNLAEARARARAFRQQIADGIDPVAARPAPPGPALC